MALATKMSLVVLTLAAAAVVNADPQHEAHGGRAERPAAHDERPAAHGEPHAGPRNYERIAEPRGWNNRPATADRPAYQHNYQAARSYHIGVYHRPRGWHAHRWAYGEILPRAYWAAPYLIADYWLFALEIPPAGYEWVRDDTDAILVNVSTGEILQVEYGVFS